MNEEFCNWRILWRILMNENIVLMNEKYINVMGIFILDGSGRKGREEVVER